MFKDEFINLVDGFLTLLSVKNFFFVIKQSSSLCSPSFCHNVPFCSTGKSGGVIMSRNSTSRNIEIASEIRNIATPMSQHRNRTLFLSGSAGCGLCCSSDGTAAGTEGATGTAAGTATATATAAETGTGLDPDLGCD